MVFVLVVSVCSSQTMIVGLAVGSRSLQVCGGLPDHPPTDQTLTIITLFTWKLTQFLVAVGHSVFRSLMSYL